MQLWLSMHTEDENKMSQYKEKQLPKNVIFNLYLQLSS